MRARTAVYNAFYLAPHRALAQSIRIYRTAQFNYLAVGIPDCFIASAAHSCNVTSPHRRLSGVANGRWILAEIICLDPDFPVQAAPDVRRIRVLRGKSAVRDSGLARQRNCYHHLQRLDDCHDHRPLMIGCWTISRIPCHPRQYDFLELELALYRYQQAQITELVNEGMCLDGTIRAWPTISGMRRRGYTAQGIREFAQRIGVSKSNNTVDHDVGLEATSVEDLRKQRVPVSWQSSGR